MQPDELQARLASIVATSDDAIVSKNLDGVVLSWNAAAERAARTEAERIGRMKDEFLATLSHELRTPLSAILGWSQLLQRSTPTPETLQEGLAVIERNARIQTQLIGDLLDMSRIISGK